MRERITVGEAIRRASRLAGVRQEDIAGAVGVSQSTISDWINGRSEPSASQLVMLDRACGQPPGYIMRDAGLLPDDQDMRRGGAVRTVMEVTMEIDERLLGGLQLLQRRGETLGELVERAITVYRLVMCDLDGHPTGRADPEDDVRRGLKLLDHVRAINQAGGDLVLRDRSDDNGTGASERLVIVL